MSVNSIAQCENENDEVAGVAYELAPLAQQDWQSIRVYSNNGKDKKRTEFQRDRERVVNCSAFRRMVDKAQIFSAEKGDYYRTRMTHSLEVNQIAKAIAFALNLNVDLTEAIALGHDIGHTPFGHQGERTLDDILSGKINVGIVVPEEMMMQRCFGGFKHNYQSARILAHLEEKYVDAPGLNVSIQVVEGVLKHTKLNKEISLEEFLPESYIEKIKVKMNGKDEVCSTLEGQTVAIADEIAQRGHDVDDALTSGVMSIQDFVDRLKIPKCEELKKRIDEELNSVDNTSRNLASAEELKIARIVSCIIHYMIETTIEHSREKMKEYQDVERLDMDNEIRMVEFAPNVKSVNDYLENVVRKRVICNCEVARADYNADVIVKTLFEKYYVNPRLLHQGTINKIFIETLRCGDKSVANSAVNLSDGDSKLIDEEIKLITKDDIMTEGKKNMEVFIKRKILIRAIVDYIAGMTDGYAINEYKKLR